MNRQLNWIVALVALTFLMLVSISPFLIDAMPLTDDGNLHVYRSIVLDDALRNGDSLYPRYVSGLAYGYGASLFNYFPPTSYYPTVIFHAMGLEWVTAWKATMIFYVLLAGFGAWLWSKQWMDATGAYVAAAAYIYAPYTLFDTVTRGSSNEFAGMALLPFALWGFTRLARLGKRSDYLLAIMTYALFIMAHNVMTLYGSLLLVAYCGLLILTSQQKTRLVLQLGSAGIFAVLLTAFFWLPALTETDFVKINGVLDNLAFIDVTNTLRTLADVFALPQTADPSQLQAIVPISFSWIALILGAIGFFLPQPNTTDKKPILGLHLFSFIILLIVTLSQLPLSADLWQSVRLLQYSQFAWRPLSIGSLVLALLAGVGASYIIRLLPSRLSQEVVFASLLALIMLYSMPWLYRPSIDLNPMTLADAQAYEIRSEQPVLSSYGEYLPVQTLQSALDPLRFQVTPDRLLSDDNITVSDLNQRGTRLSATVASDEARTIVIDWLYVPGWKARIDDNLVEVMPIGDAGLVGFEIEAGTHEIVVWYAQTAIQRNASYLSIVTVIIMLAITVLMPSALNDETHDNLLSLTPAITVILISLVLFALKTQIIDRFDNPLRNTRYQDGIIADIQTPLTVNFADEIQLLGFAATNNVRSGESTTLTLYWSLRDAPISEDYSALVQLVDAQGIVIAESSDFYIGGVATSNWLPDYYLQEQVIVDIPLYTAPIAYEWVVGVYESDTGRRLDILNSDNNPMGIDTTLVPIQIDRPTTQADPLLLPAPILAAQGFHLLAIDDLPDTVQVGDEIALSWLWKAINPTQDFSVQFIWENSATNLIDTLVVDYPYSAWQVDDVWRGYHRIIVPPTLEAGAYNLAIGVGGQSASINQAMTVTVPERDFELPDLAMILDTGWQNGISLQGYTRGDSTITLYWQTNATLNQSLRLFVQLFDAEGNLLRVQDGIPQNRPTTSWITEEVISTSYDFSNFTLDDNHTLLIGWYDERTQERVRLDDGNDALTLPYPQSE